MTQVVRFTTEFSAAAAVGIATDGVTRPLPVADLATLLAMPLADIRSVVADAGAPIASRLRLRPPIDGATEVWASGVTYLRSRLGRTEESASPSVYELVYDAERPELFFKSVAWRVVGHDETIGIREDSALNVPEPELAVVVNAHGEIVGYTICDDVSSRTLEGANPLYLPQAKIYAGSCAIGPGIVPAWMIQDPAELGITVEVVRDGEVAWSDATDVGQMRRSLRDLVDALIAPDHFPCGAILSTGTGLVPGLEFSLRAGDSVSIAIDQIGTLRNVVEVGKAGFAPQWSQHLEERAGVPA